MSNRWIEVARILIPMEGGFPFCTGLDVCFSGIAGMILNLLLIIILARTSIGHAARLYYYSCIITAILSLYTAFGIFITIDVTKNDHVFFQYKPFSCLQLSMEILLRCFMVLLYSTFQNGSLMSFALYSLCKYTRCGRYLVLSLPCLYLEIDLGRFPHLQFCSGLLFPSGFLQNILKCVKKMVQMRLRKPN